MEETQFASDYHRILVDNQPYTDDDVAEDLDAKKLFSDTKAARAAGTRDPLLSFQGRLIMKFVSFFSFGIVLCLSVGTSPNWNIATFTERQIAFWIIVYPAIDIILTTVVIEIGLRMKIHGYQHGDSVVMIGVRIWNFGAFPYFILGVLSIVHLKCTSNFDFVADDATDDYFTDVQGWIYCDFKYFQVVIIGFIILLRIHLWRKTLGRVQIFVVFGLYGILFIYTGVAIAELYRMYYETSTVVVMYYLYICCGVSTILIALIFSFWQLSVVRGANRLVVTETKKYNLAWAQETDQPNAALHIAEIKRLLEARLTRKHMRSSQARHKDQRQPFSNSLYGFDCTMRIAKLVNPWFQKISEEWCEQAQSEHADCDFHGTSRCKNLVRCKQKMHRIYEGQNTRLLDIVRAAIVCTTLNDVRKVLCIVLEDTRIEIVRWKNRYRLDHNAKQQGGYRDLQLIVRLAGHSNADIETAENDLCRKFLAELQICLVNIYELKINKSEPGSSMTDQELDQYCDLAQKAYCPHRFLANRTDAKERLKLADLSGHDKYKIRRTLLAE